MDAARVAASLLCPALVLITLGYASICAAKPFRTCRRCSGTGRRGRRLGLRSRACRRCDGAGIHIRYGRRLFNEITRTYRDGNR
jgi:DnaJ-class molecular chaperone